ncbi:MAG: hypothetical protein AAGC72_08075 [Planctomycetota bacterium]
MKKLPRIIIYGALLCFGALGCNAEDLKIVSYMDVSAQIDDRRLSSLRENPAKYIAVPTEFNNWNDGDHERPMVEIDCGGFLIHLPDSVQVDYYASSISDTAAWGDHRLLSVSLGKSGRWAFSLTKCPEDNVNSTALGYFRPSYISALNRLQNHDSFADTRLAIGNADEVNRIFTSLRHRIDESSDQDLAFHAVSADPFNLTGNEGVEEVELQEYFWDLLGFIVSQKDFMLSTSYYFMTGENFYALLVNRMDASNEDPNYLLEIYNVKDSSLAYFGSLALANPKNDMQLEEVEAIISAIFNQECGP